MKISLTYFGIGLMVLLLASGHVAHGKISGLARIDSLKKELTKAKEDTNKVNILDDLATVFSNIDPAEGLRYSSEELALASKLHWRYGIGYAHNSAALNYLSRSQPDSAMAHLKAAKVVFEQARYDKGIATVIGNMGQVYSETGNTAGALGMYRIALDIHHRQGDKKKMANVLGRIANVYLNTGNYDEALRCYERAITLSKEVGNTTNVAANLTNMGGVHQMRGNSPAALEKFFEALALYERLGNVVDKASAVANIGSVFASLGKNDQARTYFLRALEIHEQTNNKRGIASIHDNLGTLNSSERNYSSAIEHFQISLKYYNEASDKDGVAWTCGELAGTCIAMAEYTMAAAYGNMAVRLNKETGNRAQLAEALKSLGQLYLRISEHPKAAIGSQVLRTEKSINLELPDIPAGRQARLQQAIAYTRQATEIAETIGADGALPAIYRQLAEAYEKAGQREKAFNAYKRLVALQDSAYSKRNSEKITELALTHEYERKQLTDSLKMAESNRLTGIRMFRQRAYTYLGVGGALILAVVSLVVVRHNKLLAGEKRRSEDLLLNILPREVADELKADGISDARHFENVTVLFTDFVNFTAAGEQMDPRSLVAELHECFLAFDEITSRHGIEKIKTIGDAYLAVGGLPVYDADHAEKVVKAAIEIRDFMARRYARLGSSTFEIRVGVNSGNVVAGIVGVKKFAYDIWGDTVNTAARMQQASEPGKINISQATYELVRGKFNITSRGAIEVKNKGAMQMYFVE